MGGVKYWVILEKELLEAEKDLKLGQRSRP